MFSESAIECYDFSVSAVGAADGSSEAGEGGGPAEGLGSTSPLLGWYGEPGLRMFPIVSSLTTDLLGTAPTSNQYRILPTLHSIVLCSCPPGFIRGS